MSTRLLREFARNPDCSAQESIGFGSVTSRDANNHEVVLLLGTQLAIRGKK
jgi:hypothetical protein